MHDEIINEYFHWLTHLVDIDRFSEYISYNRLLSHLHSTSYRFTIRNDINRADEGVSLRYRFAITAHPEVSPNVITDILAGPCSVLEMLVALAVHCEENIMDDTRYGSRTGQWFWGMINNLGIGAMSDRNFDINTVNYVLERFSNNEYEPDGRGGLFTIPDCDRDLRKVEIWYQLNWYLNSIL